MPKDGTNTNRNEDKEDASQNNIGNEEKRLPIELQKRREAEALKRAESAERRKEEVNKIIMMEVAKTKNRDIGVMIESETSKDGQIINHKAVLKSKVRHASYKLATSLKFAKI